MEHPMPEVEAHDVPLPRCFDARHQASIVVLVFSVGTKCPGSNKSG